MCEPISPIERLAQKRVIPPGPKPPQSEGTGWIAFYMVLWVLTSAITVEVWTNHLWRFEEPLRVEAECTTDFCDGVWYQMRIVYEADGNITADYSVTDQCEPHPEKTTMCGRYKRHTGTNWIDSSYDDSRVYFKDAWPADDAVTPKAR